MIQGAKVPELTKLLGTPSVLSDEKAVTVSPQKNKGEVFDQLLKYLHAKPSKENRCYRVGSNIILFSATGVCTWLYWDGSFEYGKHQNSQTELYLQLTGSTITAAVVTYNVGQIFLKFLLDTAELQKFLRKYLDPKSANLKKEIVTTTFWSFISAVPLSIPAFNFNPDSPLALRIIKAVLTQLAYTLNHTLAIKLLNDDPLTQQIIYILLFPIIYPSRLIRNSLSSPGARYLRGVHEQTLRDHFTLKAALQNTFTTTLKQVIRTSVKARSCDFSEQKLIQGQLAKIASQDQLALQDVIELIQYVAVNFEPPPTPGPYQPVFRKLSGVIGALTMTAGVAGFVAAVYNASTEITKSAWWGAVLTSLPLGITSIITTFFGYNRLQSVQFEIPSLIKVYPKSATALLLTSAFLSFYSTATAMQLVIDNIPEGIIQDILVEFAKYGVSSFGFANMTDFVLNVLSLYAEKCGKDDEKLLALILKDIDHFNFAVNALDGKKLIEGLSKLNDADRQTLTGLDSTEFTALTKHRDNYLNSKKTSSSGTCKVRFFRCCPTKSPQKKIESDKHTHVLMPS